MHISNFEIISMVAKVQSFSKAAKLLHLTQPAVSAQIMSIENCLGTKLFKRDNRGVTLTEAGKIVYEHGEKILALYDAMEKSLDKILNEENRHLTVGASSTVGNYALPCSIWTFKERYPDVEVKLEIANSTEIIKRVLAGMVDLGIVEGPVKDRNLVVKDVSSDEILLVVPPTPQWLERNTINLEELKQERLILREQGSGMREILENTLKSRGLSLKDLNVVAEMGSTDAIKSAVEAGLGVALLSRIAVQKEIRRGTLKAMRVEDFPINVYYQLIYRNSYPSDITKRFIRFIVSSEQRIFC